jgi:hypothetical protein
MKVAALEDVLQGKVWAYVDETLRRSKRQKDLADILRMIEAFPELATKLRRAGPERAVAGKIGQRTSQSS